MKAIVVLKEQHSLMDDQVRLLNERFDSFKLHPVPAAGWTLEEQIVRAWWLHEVVSKGEEETVVVFASPIAAMIKLCMRLFRQPDRTVRIFHNDHREKKELPNGKIIHKVAKEGWQLV